MPFDVYEIKIFGAVASQQCLSVFHAKSTEDTGATPHIDAKKCIDGWVDIIQDGWLDVCPGQYTQIGLRSRRVNNGGGPSVSFATPGTPGTRGAEVSSTGIGPCMIFTYNDGLDWRSGKKFVPGVAEDDIAANAFVAGLLTALDDFYDLLTGGWDNGGLDFAHVIWSRENSTEYDVEMYTTSGKPGVQNGRMRPTF